MKKIIITRENYEEIMFGLLENAYTREEHDNILDQIHADTFLSFEWQQWQKASFAESTEFYKQSEAEFLESLTREEDKKGGFVLFYKPMAIAASLILLLGVSVLMYKTTSQNERDTELLVSRTDGNQTKDTIKILTELPANLQVNVAETSAAQRIEALPVTHDTTEISLPELESPIEQTPVMVVVEEQRPAPKVVKQSRYKVSIIEETFSVADNAEPVFKEKRYTMADVMNKKDGISLSKFLDNARKQIVEDKITHITYIEYTAADRSVLVVPLSN